MNEVNTSSINSQDKGSNAKIVYVLYLLSLIIGVTGLVGLVMAYIYRGDAPEWLKSHYQWQIRTFWMGLLYAFIGLLTTFLLVGYLILLANLVWFIIRCVKGLNALQKQQALPQPTSWIF